MLPEFFISYFSRTADGKPTFTTTPKPAQIVYTASLKFVELGERYSLPVKHTREYNELQNKISKHLRELTPLKDVPGFQDVAISKFKRYVAMAVLPIFEKFPTSQVGNTVGNNSVNNSNLNFFLITSPTLSFLKVPLLCTVFELFPRFLHYVIMNLKKKPLSFLQ